MKPRTVALSIALALGLLAVPLVAAAQGKTVIRVGSPYKPGLTLADAAEKFKEVVARESGGRIEVQIDAGNASRSNEQINEWNQNGKIEMQSNDPVFLPSQYSFFDVPYVMKDFDHHMRVWDGRLGQEARTQMEQKSNLKYLGTVYRGLRQMTAKKPIYTPADVDGLKLRLPNLATWIAVWKAMGADPIAVTLPELYNALKTGKAESSEGDLPQISSFKLDEVQSHLIVTNHLVQTGGMLINKPFFDKLSKADQDLIVKAGKEAETWANNKIKTGEAAILVDLQRKGMQVVIPDAESFRVKAKAAVEGLFQKEWPVTTWQEVLAQ